MLLAEIARRIGAKLEGDSTLRITGISKIEEAGEGDLTFLSNPKYERYVSTTRASAIIVPEDFKTDRKDISLLRIKDPYVAFVFALRELVPPAEILPPGIHETAYVSPKAKVGKGVRVGPLASVMDSATVGENVIISNGSVVGTDAEIGDNTVLYPNVTVYRGCRIGKNVIVHSGTVIGSDGFGFAPKPDGTYEKIPQMGIVAVEDDVEIGSNCSIDRATLGETRICRGVKIDNLVQVAHNVVIGESTVIAAQSGISGSTKIGKHCMIGGQVGFAGHLEIADNTNFGAQSGVAKSIKEPGKTYFGYPAREIHDTLRIWGALDMLPKLVREIADLEQKVAELVESRRNYSGPGDSVPKATEDQSQKE